jgi:DNA-binding MarR family transcriptional regulator
MSLPPRQVVILRYLAARKSATAGDVARHLLIGRDAAQNALRLLDGKGLVAADHSTAPVSFAATEAGHLVLAAITAEAQRRGTS